MQHRSLAQEAGAAKALGGVEEWTKPRQVHARLAQSVERTAVNRKVDGSNPSSSDDIWKEGGAVYIVGK